MDGFRGRVEICQEVVGNTNAERVEFVLQGGNNAMSSLERWAYPHRSQNMQVPEITLDRTLANWQPRDVLKIDAEGAEARV